MTDQSGTNGETCGDTAAKMATKDPKLGPEKWGNCFDTSLSYANGPGYTRNCELQPEGSKQFPHAPEKIEGIQKCRPSLRDVATHEKDYLQDATVALSRETHGGEDVAIYARGPSAWLFSGVVEQNYIFHALTEALGPLA